MSTRDVPRWSSGPARATRPAGDGLPSPRANAAATREGHGAFVARQLILIGGVMTALIVGQTSSAIFVGLTFPLLYPVFPYFGWSLLLALVFIGAVGVFTVLRARDTGWPVFLMFVGLWIFVFALEDAILQWFTFQLGFGLSGGRINVIMISAFMVALGFAVLLHMNQVARSLHGYFADRGVDRDELVGVEAHVRATANKVVWPIVGTIAGASLVLLIGELILGGARLGVGALGIMGGLAVILVLATLVFRALAEGPEVERAQDAGRDEGTATGRRPPPRWS